MSISYRPFVSIIIPTYNRATLLLQAVQSVLNQTYQNFEILVIDDHSTDNTPKLISEIDDIRVHYIRLVQNQGAPVARNIGLKKAKGELVAFLDSDDEWHQTKLEKQIGVFAQSNSNLGVVYTGLKIINVTKKSETIITPTKRGKITEHLLTQNYLGTTSSVVIKKEILNYVGGFDLSFTSCQDWDLFIRLSLKTDFDFIDEPLVYYFEHDGNRISTNSNAIVKGYLNIHHKYNELLGKLSKPLIQKHYLTIGKYILKAGVLSQDKKIIKVGRSFLFKSIKILPPGIKSLILYFYSLHSTKTQLLLYRILNN